MSSDNLCLKWKDFHTNISLSFKEIREDQEFSNVTLVGEGNLKIKVHKVILAASSRFFKDLLRDNQHPHPLLYMRGIKGEHLTALVDFMYHGEANILQEDLDEFLVVAKELELKGLSGPQFTEEYENKSNNSYVDSNTKYLKPQSPMVASQKIATNQINQIKKEAFEEPAFRYDSNGVVFEDTELMTEIVTDKSDIGLDDKISSYMEQNMKGNWVCKLCGKIDTSLNQKQNMKSHIEVKHIEGFFHDCNMCEKSFKARKYLGKHVLAEHKVMKK